MNRLSLHSSNPSLIPDFGEHCDVISVIVDDFDVERRVVNSRSLEADSPAIVNANAELVLSIPLQCFESIAWNLSEICEISCGVEPSYSFVDLRTGDTLKPGDEFTVYEIFGLSISEPIGQPLPYSQFK